MTEKAVSQSANIRKGLDALLPALESVHKDIHSHPELSMQEVRTSHMAAHQLRAAGYEVTTGIGKTDERVRESQPTTASEDFGCFGSQWHVRSVFWFVGGTHPEVYAQAEHAGKVGELPTHHNPRFDPVIHPTLKAGAEAVVVAAQAWLSA